MSAATRPADLAGRRRRRVGAVAFSPALMVGLVIVGLFAFSALILLSSYADELRPDDTPIATAQDPSAVGYLALRHLLDEAGVETRTDPYAHKGAWDGRSIRLYFPTPAFSKKRAERIDRDVPGILVLPKWIAIPIEDGATDVIRPRDPGLSSTARNIMDILLPDDRLLNGEEIRASIFIGDANARQAHVIKYPQFIAPPKTDLKSILDNIAEGEAANEQQIDAGIEGDEDAEKSHADQLGEGTSIVRGIDASAMAAQHPPTLTGSRSGVYLKQIEGTKLYVLSEPDLFNNQALKIQSGAEAAIGILSLVSAQFDIADPIIVFDDSLRRRDTRQNLVKLLTRPPFLAATLCLLAAGAFVGWQSVERFGDPERSDNDQPRGGSASLARTSAQFIRGAGRMIMIAPFYSDVVRRQVIEALGVALWDETRIDALIEKREMDRQISPSFEDIKADKNLDPMARATALGRWKNDILS